MESKNRVGAVIIGMSTFFGCLWAFGTWMYTQGEESTDLVQKLRGERAQLEQELAECKDGKLPDDPGSRGGGDPPATNECAELRAEVVDLRVRVALKELPVEVSSQIRLLSNPGVWKPEATEGHLLKENARYGLEPQPHSLSALKAIGALDDSTQGQYALYTVLTIKFDKERPRRFRVFNLSYHRGWPPTEAERLKQFTLDEGARKEWEWLVEVQKALREYGDELVAAGYLAK